MAQPNPPQGDPEGGNTPPAPQGEPDDRAELKGALDKERQAAQDAQKALRAANARVAELEKNERERADKEKTDLEKAEERAKAAEEAAATAALRVKAAFTRAEITLAAGKFNAIDADDVYRLIDLDELDYDDEGRPTNAESVVEKLLKAKPHLVKAETAPGRLPPPSSKPGEKVTEAEKINQTRQELRRQGGYRL